MAASVHCSRQITVLKQVRWLLRTHEQGAKLRRRCMAASVCCSRQITAEWLGAGVLVPRHNTCNANSAGDACALAPHAGLPAEADK